jgi:hypothetical protein
VKNKKAENNDCAISHCRDELELLRKSQNKIKSLNMSKKTLEVVQPKGFETDDSMKNIEWKDIIELEDLVNENKIRMRRIFIRSESKKKL